MKIYQSEINDGIAEQIKTCSSIAYLSKARANSQKATEQDLKEFATKANANPDQFDLYYLDSVLVSTGWNLNDDVFDPAEMWDAKSSPVDKQFNYMHDEKDIIGHITSSAVMVGDKLYEGDSIPEEDFNIVEGSVLYRVWNDEKLKARMDELISEIEEGKWYVSMECLFANFDYAMVSPEGTQSIVSRTKTTAYLSKHLRAYGGQGSYDGYKIGRLLRNITFSGKGLVDEPANPSSIIFNGQDVKTLTKSFKGSVASRQWEKNMTEEMLKAQAAELTKQVEGLKAENKALEAEVRAKAEKENAEKVAGLDKTISGLNEKVTETEKASAESAKKAASLVAIAEETQVKLDEALKEIDILKASINKAKRVAELTKAGVEADKHEGLITKFANVADDIFAEFVELHAKKFVPFEKKGDEKKDDKKSKAALDDAEKALEDAEAAKAALASTVDETDKTKQVRAKASEWLTNTFKATASRNIRKTSQDALNAK